MTNYRLRIGAALPSWVPAAGEVATLTVANGGLANNFASECAPYYDSFWYTKTSNSYGGGAKNKYWGRWGCTVHFSGGHSNSNDNSVTISEYGDTQITFRRITDPVPWFGQGTDSTTKESNSNGNLNADPLLDWFGGAYGTGNYPPDYLVYGEAANLTGGDAAWNGQPGASHTYGLICFIGPEHGGATYGTLMLPQLPAVGYANTVGANSCHALELTSTTAPSSSRMWIRHTNEIFAPGGPITATAPGFSVYDSAFDRIIMIQRGNNTNVRWYDVAAGDWVEGTGAPFGYSDNCDSVGGNRESGCAFLIPERDLLICAYSAGGVVRIEWMDISVAQPTLGGVATLSQALSTFEIGTSDGSRWGACTYCTHSGKIIAAAVEEDDEAAYEITAPATLTDTWTVTRAPYGTGQTFFPAGHTVHQKFQYDEKLKSIVFFLGAVQAPNNDTVYVYRPRNT